MKVYHGSPNKFEKFDYKRMGTNGTSEGFGFYFTDKKEVAERYANEGYLYEATLKGKELSGNDLTITKEEYIKLVEILDQKGEYLSNFGDKDYEGFSNVLKMAIECDYEHCPDDAQLIGGIINAYGSVEKVLKIVYDVLGYGYIKDQETGWNSGTVYVALVNEAIEVKAITKIRKEVVWNDKNIHLWKKREGY